MDGIEDVDDNRDQWTIALKLNCIDGAVLTNYTQSVCLSVCLNVFFFFFVLYLLFEFAVCSLPPPL